MSSTTMKSSTTVIIQEPLQTAFMFGIPTILIFVSFWIVRPILERVGFTAFEAVFVTITAPLALLFFASLIGFALEKRAEPDLRLRERFRLPAFSYKYLLRGFVVFIVGTLLYGLLYIINWIVLDALGVGIPANATPIFANNENSFDTSGFEAFVGAPLGGNYIVFVLYLIMLFFNIIGEEFWWRGYVLPRQEKYYGTYTWIIHGLLWTTFHLFKWWDMIPLLGVTLFIAYVAQKYKETWSSIIAHLLFNGMFAIILFDAVFL